MVLLDRLTGVIDKFSDTIVSFESRLDRLENKTPVPAPQQKRPDRIEVHDLEDPELDQDPQETELDRLIRQVTQAPAHKGQNTEVQSSPHVSNLIEAFEVPDNTSSPTDRKMFVLALTTKLLSQSSKPGTKIEMSSHLRTIEVLLGSDLNTQARHAIALLAVRCHEIFLVETRSPQYATSWSRSVTAASKGSDLLVKAHREGTLAEASAPKQHLKSRSNNSNNNSYKGKSGARKKPSDPKKD